jgi:hypothetical protein
VVPYSRSPAHHGLLVAPAGERQDPALAGEAAVADVLHEAVDLLQLGPQDLGVPEIGVPLLGARMSFEDHGEHASFLLHGVLLVVAVTSGLHPIRSRLYAGHSRGRPSTGR